MVEAPEQRRSAPEVTNTLIITKVPPALLQSSVSPSLREFFERYGSIEAWVPLTTFERVVVVYTNSEDAEKAKLGLDYTLVEGFEASESTKSSSLLRVYRGLNTPLDILRNRRLRDHLPVPETDKNFLISPPGSPPVGWEQIREDPPNVDTLADDLVRALESLTMSFDDQPATQDVHPNSHFSSTCSTPADGAAGSSTGSPRDTLIIPHQRTPSGELPSVLVSDTDMQVPDQSSSNGLTISQAFSIQRRAAVGPISNVKATVESMQGSSFPANAPRIDRTPRPPINS